MTPMVERFKALYHALTKDNLGLLDEVYARNLHFEDPLHTIDGLEPFRAYLARLYAGVHSCRFNFHEEAVQEEVAILTWTMELRHRRLNRGRLIVVPGASCIRSDGDRIAFHRDYFDAGALLYEQIPLLGSLIRVIKRNA